jgi:hypothetical protein
VESGTVTFNGGGSGNGQFTGAGSSSVTGGTLTISGTAQNLLLAGGTVDGVNGSISNLTWSSGTLQGSNIITGSSSWTGGTLNSGSTLTVASNAVLNLNGSDMGHVVGGDCRHVRLLAERFQDRRRRQRLLCRAGPVCAATPTGCWARARPPFCRAGGDLQQNAHRRCRAGCRGISGL